MIIISGPAGVGKSTVIRELLADTSMPLRLSVSATTRAPRPGEQDGRDYHFWTREQFDRAAAAGKFQEYALVHEKHYYGTPIDEVAQYRAQGTGVILEIDVQGFDQVKRKCPEAYAIFLRAPSDEDYERRLRSRHTEGEAEIQRRLHTARMELQRAGDYNIQLVNDDLNQTVARLRQEIVKLFQPRPDGGTSCSMT